MKHETLDAKALAEFTKDLTALTEKHGIVLDTMTAGSIMVWSLPGWLTAMREYTGVQAAFKGYAIDLRDRRENVVPRFQYPAIMPTFDFTDQEHT